MKRIRKSSKKPTPDKLASAHDLINQAVESQAVTLDLSGQGLTELPESVGRLSWLRNLDLSNNQLKSLPESIGQLTQLQSLNLADNQLQALPEPIGRLIQLEHLRLSRNALKAFPGFIGQMRQLRHLDLSGNQLKALPAFIRRLRQLEYLGLSENSLRNLPEAIGELTLLGNVFLSFNSLKRLPESLGRLTQLLYLDLSHNQLKGLPEAIGLLTQMLGLYLNDNQLETLPESIGHLTRLGALALSNNQLKTLPEAIGQLTQLQALYLNLNQLEMLPESIGRLTKLQHLDLSENQLKTLPESLLKIPLTLLYLHSNDKLGLPPEVLGPSRAEVEVRSAQISAVPAKPRDILEYHFPVRTDQRQPRQERPMDDQKQPVRLFYSYSRKDERLRNELEIHLKLLQRQGLIEPWHDRKIEAGDEWKHKIDENLEHAEIILLLVSADFIASDYCYEEEMKRALERHEQKEARLVPIILRDVNWKIAPFEKLQALPKDGRPVTKWRPRDSAWRNVSEGIERVVAEMRKMS